MRFHHVHSFHHVHRAPAGSGSLVFRSCTITPLPAGCVPLLRCVQVVHDYTVEHGAYPSPLHYHHFPKSVCTSVNEVVCHGIPDMRELESGDIVNVDVTCLLKGYHGDLNETFTVGDVDDKSKKLVKVGTH